jgi:hypothetical protein
VKEDHKFEASLYSIVRSYLKKCYAYPFEQYNISFFCWTFFFLLNSKSVRFTRSACGSNQLFLVAV